MNDPRGKCGARRKGFLLKYVFEGPSKYWQISGFVAKYIGPNN